jgi:hypothetical protein
MAERAATITRFRCKHATMVAVGFDPHDAAIMLLELYRAQEEQRHVTSKHCFLLRRDSDDDVLYSEALAQGFSTAAPDAVATTAVAEQASPGIGSDPAPEATAAEAQCHEPPADVSWEDREVHQSHTSGDLPYGWEVSTGKKEGFFSDQPGGPPALVDFFAKVQRNPNLDSSVDNVGLEEQVHACLHALGPMLTARLHDVACKVYAIITFVTEAGFIYKRTPMRITPTVAEVSADVTRLQALISGNDPATQDESSDDMDADEMYDEVDDIDLIEIKTVIYAPFGGCIRSVVLPLALAAKKAVVNVQNGDARCFIYAVCSVLFPVQQNPQRPKQYECRFNAISMADIEFPVGVDDVPKFERLNREFLKGKGIDVYGTSALRDGDFVKPFPIRISRERFTDDGELIEPVRLLLFREHFLGIRPDSLATNGQTAFQRLFSSQNQRMKVCPRCCQTFHDHFNIKGHMEHCSGREASRVELPKPGSTEHFLVHSAQAMAPVVLYADFECYMEESNGAANTTLLHGKLVTTTVNAVLTLVD